MQRELKQKERERDRDRDRERERWESKNLPLFIFEGFWVRAQFLSVLGHCKNTLDTIWFAFA